MIQKGSNFRICCMINITTGRRTYFWEQIKGSRKITKSLKEFLDREVERLNEMEKYEV